MKNKRIIHSQELKSMYVLFTSSKADELIFQNSEDNVIKYDKSYEVEFQKLVKRMNCRLI